MNDTVEFVLSNSQEIWETAEELGLEECSNCGTELRIEKKTGTLWDRLMDFLGRPNYETNIRSISNLPYEDAEANCTECDVI